MTVVFAWRATHQYSITRTGEGDFKPGIFFLANFHLPRIAGKFKPSSDPAAELDFVESRIPYSFVHYALF